MHAISAVTHDNPYPYYAALAAQPGLAYDAELRLWVAAGAAAVAEVLNHPDCRVRPPDEPVPAALAGGSASLVFGALVRMNDGERHAVPKLVLQRALATMDADTVRTRALAVAGMLAASRDLRQARELSAWMFDVPVSTVASLLGFPDSQLAPLAAWMVRFVACLSPLSSAAQIAQAHEAAQALLASFTALLQAAPAPPGSLLDHVIAEARAAGWDNAQAILANLVGLLSQTYEATAGLIGNGIVALLCRPDDMPAQERTPEHIAALVRRVGRDDPPVQNTRRFVARAADICGVHLEAGQAILVVLAAAGRDPAAGEHLYGYGQGRHACPGQALSQNIAAAAIDVLLQTGMPQRMTWRYRPSVNARIPEFIATEEN
ncbi:MAG: cytochrome P450 [Pseudomonadota bacterium]